MCASERPHLPLDPPCPVDTPLMFCRVVRANEQAVFCTLRTRLVAEVFSGGRCVASHHAFNEACIDRGPAVNFLRLDAYIDGSYVTTIQV